MTAIEVLVVALLIVGVVHVVECVEGAIKNEVIIW